MKGALAVAGKDLRELLRERTVLVALAVQLFIAAFSSTLVFGLSGLYDPANITASVPADVGYVGEGGFDQLLRTTRNLRVQPLDGDDALAAFNDRRILMLIEERVEDDVHRIRVAVGEGEVTSTLLVTQVRGLLERYERQLREERHERLHHELVDTAAPPGGSYDFLHATLWPLLVLAPVFLAGALAGDSFAQEVQTRTLLLLRSAPVGLRGLLAAKLAVPLLLAPAQMLLWAGLILFNRTVISNLPLLTLLTIMLTALLSGIGLLLAAFVRQQGATQAAYAMAALIVGGASLWLPRDPINLIAVLGAGGLDGEALSSLGIISALGIALLATGVFVTAKRIRNDKLGG